MRVILARRLNRPSTTSQTRQVDRDEVAGIIEAHGSERSALIAILTDIQTRYRYLPQDALRTVADRTGVSLVDVYAAATFYHSFSLKPMGEHIVSCCLGTACHVRGAPRIADELQRQLGIDAGDTTPDMQFTMQTVNCLGACALGPIVVADGRYFPNVTPAKVESILHWAQSASEEADDGDGRMTFPVVVRCQHCCRSLTGRRSAKGPPLIRLTAAWADRRVPIELSSLYGACSLQSDPGIPASAAVRLLCPHCDVELAGGEICLECGGPMAGMPVEGGGTLWLCLRLGCHGQTLNIGRSGSPVGSGGGGNGNG